MEVKWGKFVLTLVALNVNNISKTHKLKFIKGGFGKIYFINNND